MATKAVSLSPTNYVTSADDPSWAWEENRWRVMVDKVRAGRSLKPAQWPGGAKVAVRLVF